MKNFFFYCLLLLAASGSLHAQTPAQNKETALKILSAVDAGDLNAFSRYVSSNVVEHMPIPPETPGSNDFEKVKNLIAAYHTAFPDGKTTVLHVVAEGDIVIIHGRYAGTNKGAFMGMPATNKSVQIEQTDIIRFDASGKGVEHWAVIDQLGMLQQLGLIPTDGK